MGSPLYEAWLEAQALLMESLKSWKPLKEVSQADLDRALGDTQAPVPDTHRVAKSTRVEREAITSPGSPPPSEECHQVGSGAPPRTPLETKEASWASTGVSRRLAEGCLIRTGLCAF